MPRFTFRFRTLHFDGRGAGPCVVFQHGLGSSHQQAFDLFGDQPDMTIISMDAPSHGESDSAPELHSFDAMADAVVGLLDHLDINACFFGGISMGSGISLNAALRHPSRVAGLLLVRPAWLEDPDPANLEIIARLGHWIVDEGLPAARRHLHDDDLFQQIRAVNQGSADSITGALDAPGAERLGRVFIDMVGDAPFSSLAGLSDAKIPAIVLATEDDPLHPVDMASRIAEALPNAALRMTPPRYVEPEQHADVVRAFARAFVLTGPA